MNKNKRGQSEIITTVLIILLVLAAIVIVWQVVKSTIESGSSSINEQTGCIGIDFDITNAATTLVDGADVDLLLDDLAVSITRKSGGTSDKITPIILVNGVVKTTDFLCNPTTLGQLESTSCTSVAAATSYAAAPTKVEVGGSLGTVACNTLVCSGAAC